MKTAVIEGQLRKDMGKKVARSLRSEGNVLGVVYGGKEEIHFYAPLLAFRNVVYTPEFMFVEIKVEGKSYTTILKDVQFDVVTDKLIHADFLELVPHHHLVAELPLKFIGTPAGVKAGGKLQIRLKKLRVRTYPENLDENIKVDISGIELNGNMRVQDVVVKEGTEVLVSPRQPVASVVLTRALKQAESAATAK